MKLAWILATASLWERQYTPFGTILPIVGSQFPAKYGTGDRVTVGAASAAMIRGDYDSQSRLKPLLQALAHPQLVAHLEGIEMPLGINEVLSPVHTVGHLPDLCRALRPGLVE